ncbi:MAG: VCBS repeat-containing protein [bacterium]|nr:VCBS repeat-containing protein [bacterium]
MNDAAIDYLNIVSGAANTTAGLVVQTGGNVGIGTTNPLEKLQVGNGNGSLRIDGPGTDTIASANTGIYLGDSSNAGVIRHRASGGLAFDTYDGTWRENLTITGSGNVGIGITAPTGLLDVGIGSSSFIVLANGNVGIGITNPAYKFDVSGNIHGSTIYQGASQVCDASGNCAGLGGTIGGSGTTNYISKFTSASNIGISQIFDNGTNVGIGLSNPGGLFNVGIGATNAFVVLANGNVGVGLTNPGGLFNVGIGQTAGLVVLANGKVGIGLTNPTRNLEVVGPGNTFIVGKSTGATSYTQFRMEASSGSTVAGLALFNPSFSANGVYTPNSIGFQAIAANGFNIVNEDATTGYLGFVTGGFATTNERMRIDVNGNVGIGTSAPKALLDVNQKFTVLAGGNVGVGLTNPGGLFNVGIGQTAGLVVLANGNVGIGTSAPVSLFDVNSKFNVLASGNVGVGLTNPGGLFNVGIGQTAGLVVLANGNVGVGLTNPSYKLDVNGTIRGDFFLDSSNVAYGIDPAGTSNFGGYSLKVTGGALLGYDSGNVGIGATTTNSKLAVAGGISIGTTVQSSSFLMATAPSGGLLVEGNVGIGTTSPLYKLHLTGSVGDYLSYTYNTATGSTAQGAFIRIDGTGNILTLNASGSDIVTISPQAATFNVPTSFTSSGDVAIAYDINFNNPVSSYIKSQAPLYVQSGESFNSDDLTLRSFNYGDIVLEAGVGVTSAGGTIRFNDSNIKGTTVNPIPFSSTFGEINTYSLNFGSTASLVNALNTSYSAAGGGAGGVWRLTGSNLYPASTTYAVGIGTTAPGTAKLAVMGGNVGIGNTAPAGLLNVGVGSSSLIVLSSGNVGIGTTGPGAKLEVKGSGVGTVLIGEWGGSSNYGAIGFNGSLATGNANFYSLITAGSTLYINRGTGGDISFRENNVDQMVIKTSTGNVGIGSTNPLAALHIQGSITGEQLRLDDISTTGSPFLTFFQAGTRRAFIQSNDTNDNLIFASEYGDISFKAASSAGSDTDTEYMRIKAGGNVGIGLTNPGGLFNVGIGQTSGLTVLSNGNVGIGTSSPISLFDVNRKFNILAGGNVGIGITAPAGLFNIGVGNSSFIVLANGNVGVGATIANSRLAVAGGMSIGTTSLASNFLKATAPSGGLLVEGNTGIGTTAPVGKLQVVGGINADNLIFSSSSTNILNAYKGFNGYTGFTGGIGTGGIGKDSITGAMRMTSDGNLVNIGSIQAGEMNLTKGGMFGTKVDIASGTNPDGIAMGDLNGDGKADLAVANRNPNTVSVYINNGAGTFAAKVDYATETTPSDVAIGDLNGDGKADMVVGSSSSIVSVYINNGDGTFVARVNYATGTSASAGVKIGDLNGDGKADIASTGFSATVASVLLNKGDGTFAAKADYATGTNPVGLALGDVDGDGKADLATADYGSTSVSVFINIGSGTFGSHVTYAANTNPSGIAIGDVDGDGKADLAVTSQGSTKVSVYINNGAGTFAAKVDYTIGTTPLGVALGDLNGDGKADIVAGNNADNTISVLLNNGAGTFATQVTYATGTAPRWIVVGDLNGDGKADIAVPNYSSSSVSVFLNLPTTMLYAQASTGNVGIGLTNPGGLFNVGVGQTNAFVVLLNGNVGIGTSSPVSLLDVNRKFNVLAGGNVGIGNTAPAGLLNVGVGSSSFIILSNGNVGIGNTLPGTKFSVTGDITLSGLFHVGPPIRYSRTTAAYNATDATKDTACTTDFGNNYQAGGLLDASAYSSGGQAVSVSQNFVVAGNTANQFYVAAGGTGAPTVTANSTGTVGVACVRKDAPLRFTRTNTAAYNAADSTKDTACTGEFGTNYQAAGGQDVSSIAKGGDNATFFVVGGNTANRFYLYPIGAAVTVASSGTGTQLVACIRNGTQTGADIAEFMPTSEQNLSAGDILSIDPRNNVMSQKSQTSYDQKVIGIVPTKPGLILGDQGQDASDTILALAGRVPVKVSTINGSIKRGDPITTSSIPGMGMVSTQAGSIVGKALEEFDPANGKGTVISCPSTTPFGITCGTILAFVNISWYDPGAGGYFALVKDASNSAEIVYNENTAGQSLFNVINATTGTIVHSIGTLAELTVGKINSGMIQAQHIITNQFTAQTANIQNLLAKNIHVEQKIVSPVVETTDLIASGSAKIAKLETNVIKPQNKDVTIDLSSPVTAESQTDPGQARMTEEQDGPLAKLIVKGNQGKSVVVIDSAGNASFSGQLIADSIVIENDATISGTLAAGAIVTNDLTSANAMISGTLAANEASLSGKLIAKEIQSDNISSLTNNINDIQRLLADIKNQPLSNPDTNTNLSQTTNLGSQNINGTLSTSPQLENLTVTGSSNLYNVSVTNSLTAGNVLIQDNTILSLNWELRLSALSSINLLDGAVTIARDGTLTSKGEIIAQGGVRTNTLQPINKNDDLTVILGTGGTPESHIDPGQARMTNTKLAIQNQLGTEVASIDASGSAKFNGLALNTYLDATSSAAIIAAADNFSRNGIYAPAIETKTNAAGVGQIPGRESEIVIYNDTIKDGSLIYITPTDSLQSTQLTMVQKQTCTATEINCRPYFKVAAPAPTISPVRFNWLIIN